MTQHKDRKARIRARMAETGEPYSEAARQFDSPRTADATVTRVDGRGWRVVIPETAERGGRTLSWPVGVPWDDRDTLIKKVAGDVDCYGWAAVTWPAEVTTEMTIPLARNTSGHRIDEAERLHQAAGVTYHKAHHAYIEAVAATVEAAGIVIGDIGADCDEPRGGSFRIGGDLEDFWDDDEGYGPSMVIQWREDRGWYHIWFSDSQAALGDYTEDLPGSLPLMATPEQVAEAVQALVPERCQCGGGTLPAIPAWQMPRGYEADPPSPEDDGWDVSPRLERSLTAYVGLRPPEGLPAWLARS